MRNLYFCWILPRKLSYTHMRTGIVKKRWFSIDSTNLPPNAIIIKSLKEMKRADKERAFLRKTLFMRQATRNDDLQSLALMVQQMNSLIWIWKTKLLKDGSITKNIYWRYIGRFGIALKLFMTLLVVVVVIFSSYFFKYLSSLNICFLWLWTCLSKKQKYVFFLKLLKARFIFLL